MIRQPSGYTIPDRLNDILAAVVAIAGLDYFIWLDRMDLPRWPFPYTEEEIATIRETVPALTHDQQELCLRRTVFAVRRYLASEMRQVMTGKEKKYVREEELRQLVDVISQYRAADKNLSNETIRYVSQEIRQKLITAMMILDDIDADIRYGDRIHLDFPPTPPKNIEKKGAPEKKLRTNIIIDLENIYSELHSHLKFPGKKYIFIKACLQPLGFSEWNISDGALRTTVVNAGKRRASR